MQNRTIENATENNITKPQNTLTQISHAAKIVHTLYKQWKTHHQCHHCKDKTAEFICLSGHSPRNTRATAQPSTYTWWLCQIAWRTLFPLRQNKSHFYYDEKSAVSCVESNNVKENESTRTHNQYQTSIVFVLILALTDRCLDFHILWFFLFFLVWFCNSNRKCHCLFPLLRFFVQTIYWVWIWKEAENQP